jgi:hypothetical protein
MREWLPLLSGLAGLLPATAMAQARVEAIIPENARISVEPLGADGPALLTVGTELMPGDLVTSQGDSVSMKLACGEAGTVEYLVGPSPFRLLIDVPTVASCHVDLLLGSTEVKAEAPTETSAGGVTLGSLGTQYAVELRRERNTLILNCLVYDDTVRVLTWSGMEAVAGNKLIWSAGTVDVASNTRQDLTKSAATYARFDLATAEKEGMAIPDRNTTFLQLTTLHYEVLADPTSESKRVELAKEQLKYKVTDQAMFNLKRVELESDTALRRHQIDPGVIRRDTSVSRPMSARVTPEIRRAAVAAAVARPTERDLRLIEAGRLDDALENLNARVSDGTATSRDYYALARAWAERDATRMRAYAGRALVLHATDDRLTAADLRVLGELISGRD